MKIASWNAKVGRGDAAFVASLKQLIADIDPDLIAMQEAGGYVDAARKSFPGWITVAAKGWTEANDNPIMVKRDGLGEPDNRGHVRTTTAWVGPQGGTHHGRTWMWVRYGDRFVMSLHRCTDGDRTNRAASQEERGALLNWIRAREGRQIVIVGDHNWSPKRHDPNWSSWSVSDDAGAKLEYNDDDPGIDFAIVKGVPVGEIRRGKRYGSDHEAIVLRVPD